ncbi:hypothetical protein [Demequina phytophila]|uniref:hypothetical protein n=1 Tax=Demequina phytophila TaxID=1638981 RepID=UPI000780C4D6|nr:hypothetical protein [Demequina phytophila]
MSSTDAPVAAPSRPLVGATASWLATAIGIPLYGLIALGCALAAAPLANALAPDTAGMEGLAMFVAVAIVNVLIAVIGVPVIAHTLGRWVFARTSHASTRAASRGFAVMGALLAVPLVVFIALGQSLHAVGGLYAALAIGVPCGVTAGLTRAILPWVAATPARRGWVGAIGAAGLFAVVWWAIVVLFGPGF